MSSRPARISRSALGNCTGMPGMGVAYIEVMMGRVWSRSAYFTMSTTDTIAAIATPPGRGGIGIVRISGPEAGVIARELTGHAPKARRAQLRRFKDEAGAVLDTGLVLYFQAPDSF